VGEADQLPFRPHVGEPAEGEAPEAAGPLDLSEHRFHDRLAEGIGGVPGHRMKASPSIWSTFAAKGMDSASVAPVIRR
jgi:hypothetical protein